MSEWREYSFNDLADITSSKRIFFNEYVEDGIPFYRSKEIIVKALGKKLTDCLYISEEKFQEIKTKYGIPIDNDILLTAVGTCGVPYLVKNDGDFYFKDGNLIWFKNIKDIVNSKFLYYWLNSNIGKNELEKITIGSVQKALTIDGIKNIKINLPPLHTQKRISEILSALDGKIAVNNKMNRLLEELAETIFHEWFINFNFKNSEGKPYKKSGGKMVESELGDIPEGWRVETLSNVVSVIKGRKPENMSSIKNEVYNTPYLTIDCYSGNKPNYVEHIEKMHVNELDIVMVMDGNAGRLFYGLDGILSSTMAKFIVDDKNLNEIVFHFLKSIEYDLMDHTTGSVIQHADKQYTLNKKFCIPNEGIEKYANTFKAIRNKVIINKIENNKLAELRDTLLPKLMSGELKV